jgi:hypothetical protein
VFSDSLRGEPIGDSRRPRLMASDSGIPGYSMYESVEDFAFNKYMYA